MTVVITVTVLRAIFLLNYPCVFTNTEVSHSSHFSYTLISLSLFFLSFLFLLDLWWDLYRLRFLILLWSYIWIIITFKSLNTILRKLKRWNHTFHRDPVTSEPLQSPRISFITGTATWSLIFFDGNHRALACIQHDKDWKWKISIHLPKMSSKMSSSTVIKKENLT